MEGKDRTALIPTFSSAGRSDQGRRSAPDRPVRRTWSEHLTDRQLVGSVTSREAD
jgi:hypothetical protein